MSSYEYRKIWKKHFEIIPKDSEGRTYEIHHKDGDRNNNKIENLLCVSIKEHFDLHHKQGDLGACVMIGKRMKLPTDYLSKIQTGVKRPGIGGVKKGTIPWNKGKKNCWSEKTIKKWKEIRKGKIHSSKVNEKIVKKIREFYDKKPKVNFEVNKVMGNGKKMSYEQAFSKTYYTTYGLTSNGLKKIVEKKSWTNVYN